MIHRDSLITHHWVSLTIRFVLGAVFIFAGVPKIMDTATFANAVYNYQLLPDVLVNLFAIFLPWLEVIVGVLLILGVWLPGAVVIYNGLVIIFIAALVINFHRGLDISCGCFSTDSTDVISFGTILRDVALFMASLYLLFVVFCKKNHERQSSAEKNRRMPTQYIEIGAAQVDRRKAFELSAGHVRNNNTTSV